jgi:hypothetical protein
MRSSKAYVAAQQQQALHNSNRRSNKKMRVVKPSRGLKSTKPDLTKKKRNQLWKLPKVKGTAGMTRK